MPKISSLNAKSVIIKFIAKSIMLTVVSVLLLSGAFSFIILKLDLDLSYCKYASYIICALTSFLVPFICLKPFKNNILFLSFASIIPFIHQMRKHLSKKVYNKDAESRKPFPQFKNSSLWKTDLVFSSSSNFGNCFSMPRMIIGLLLTEGKI